MCIRKIINKFRRQRRSAAPPTDKTLGIDTSHWNGYFDFAKAKSKGVKFVIQKICDVNSSGTAMFYDIKAEQNYIAAKGKGLIFGGYAWLNPFFDVNAQAQFYINWYKSHDVDFPPILDFEDTHFTNANDYISKAQQWLSIVFQSTGRMPIIYTAEWFMSKFNRANTAWMGQYHLWVAHYTARTYPTIPREWFAYKIWQYSDRGTYPYYEAVTGKGREWGSTSYSLDMNWFNGTYDKLLEFCNIGDAEPLPEPPVEPPAPEKPLYKAIVTTTPPNRLRVRKTPNGEFIRWLNSGDAVSVYEEAVDWLRINPNEWISSNPNWVQRLPDEGQIADGLFNVQLWSQRDPRWSNDRMGSSYITLGQEGCLVTCTASIMNYFGIDTDPKRYNQLLSTRGGYQYPNLMYWLMPETLWAGRVKRMEYLWFSGGTGWETTANAIIADGRPALAQVDFVPGGVMNQHWVLLIGKINGVWWCYDPWYGSTAALNARYSGIYRIVGYKKL